MEIWVIIPAIGASVAFVVGLFQWLDVRKREEKRLQFEQFHQVFEWVAGRTAEGKMLVDTQQAMAVYELSRFPEFRDITSPILEYYLSETENEPDSSLFRSALLYTQGRLSHDM